MSMSKLEKELVEATNLKEKKNEKRQDYLMRLCRATAKVPDDVWEGLSTAAQDWNNAAAEAITDSKPIVDFEPDVAAAKPGSEETGDPVDDLEEDEELEEESDEDEEEEEPVATKPKAKVEAKKAELHPPTKTHPGRKVSACHTIKKIVVKQPTISVADLSEKLKASGFKVSDVTIATLRSDLRDTLRVLNEVGKGEFVL